MRIVYTTSAAKALRKMQPAKAKDIVAAINRVAANPRGKFNNVTPLKGVKNGFRIRIGDWRVLFTFDYAAQIMDVFAIAPRGGAYR